MNQEPKVEPKISIIIIHYNTPQYLETCINAILNQSYANLEIIFIDNNSPDPSGLDFVAKNYEEDERVIIVPNEKNIGYAGAANQGIKMAI